MPLSSDKKRKKLNEIYSCYRRDMFITAYSILKDYQAAEDAIHNSILKISNYLDKIPEVRCKKTRSYIVIIVSNICIDHLRAEKSMDSLDALQPTARNDEMNLEEYIFKIEQSSEIASQLDRLHRPYADILVLRYYHEFSVNEISDLLGITENNVRVRLHRALDALKHILEKEGNEVGKV